MEEIIFKILTKLGSPTIACVCTILLCGLFAVRSSKNKQNGIIDDGAQQAVTVGVAFTFIGIIAALWDFNVTDVDKIKETITQFLSGMKTAFITSIIGIISSMLIKVFIQGAAEHKAQKNPENYLNSISQKSEYISKSLAKLQETLETNNSVQNFIASKTNTMAQNSTAANSVIEAIQSLKESIDKSSSGAIERAVDKLSEKMEQYIQTSQNTNNVIQKVAEQLSAQTEGIDALAMSLQNSNREQIGAIGSLGDILKESGKNQIDSIDQLGEKLNKMLKNSGLEQIAAVQNLGNMLSEIFKTSGQEQTNRLDSMNKLIAAMLNYSEQTYNNSVTALNEARDYQKDSLEISRKQQEILTQNTDRITEMKEAFNKFLDDMARKNNEEFIKALNESMKDLNQRLTEQFGENFKELNRAVFKVVEWQENYKQIIETTTEELTEINATFKKFTVDVAPKVAENVDRLQKSIDSFTETSATNVAIQKNLTETAETLNASVIQAHTAAENLINIHEELVQQQQEIMQSLESSFDKHQQKMTDALKKSTKEITELMKSNSADFAEQMQITSAAFAGIVAEITSFGDSIKNKFEEIITHNQQIVSEQMENTASVFEKIIAKQNKYTEDLAETQLKIFKMLEDEFEKHQTQTLNAIEEMTQKMAEAVEKTVRKVTSQIQATQEIFEDVIKQNQESARDAVQNTLSIFNEIIQRQQEKTKDQIESMSEKLTAISEQNQATVEKSLGKVKNAVEEMNTSILGIAINATDSITQFESTSRQIFDRIGLALDGFNTDFQGELEKAMTDLKTNLETMLNKNSEVARKNSEELAAILATVTEKMVKEYQKLADHISDIDKEIFERRAS